jgi:hypothetical protein
LDDSSLTGNATFVAADPKSAVVTAPERAVVTAVANPAAASGEAVELGDLEIHIAGLDGEELSEC